MTQSDLLFTISYNSHLELSFRHIFNLQKADIEQNVVDRGGGKGKGSINVDEDGIILQNKQNTNEILQKEERLGKDLKLLFKVAGYLYSMLVCSMVL